MIKEPSGGSLRSGVMNLALGYIARSMKAVVTTITTSLVG
jgi:hypothetical protein